MRHHSARRRQTSGAPRRDDGVVLLIFASFLSVMLVLGAFVLGGSLGYSAVRSAQNAADAAALAATNTLMEVKAGDAAPAEVLSTAVAVASDNGAEPSSVTCEVVNGTYALSKSEADVLGSCTTANVDAVSAAGIRVRTSDSRDVPFGAFVDSDTIAGDAIATATAQPLREGRAPFMICSAPTATGHPRLPLVGDLSVNPPYAFDAGAIGTSYVVQGNEMVADGRDCGNGSTSWRGLVRTELTYEMPSTNPTVDSTWWQIETGNKNGALPSLLTGAGSCAMPNGEIGDLAVGCRLLLPLCPKGNGATGTNFRLYCVRMALFEVSYIGKVSVGTAPCHPTQRNNIVCADLIGPGTAAVGRGGASAPGANDVVVVRLVQ